MPHTAVKFGRILILIGIIGYAASYFSGSTSPTALIPAAFGIVLMVLGYIANAKESLRKHVMHVAVLVGFLGFIMPAIMLIRKIGALSLSLGVTAQIVMSLTCLIFVVLCVKSFKSAREDN